LDHRNFDREGKSILRDFVLKQNVSDLRTVPMGNGERVTFFDYFRHFLACRFDAIKLLFRRPSCCLCLRMALPPKATKTLLAIYAGPLSLSSHSAVAFASKLN
jgi:hypothetical protein